MSRQRPFRRRLLAPKCCEPCEPLRRRSPSAYRVLTSSVRHFEQASAIVRLFPLIVRVASVVPSKVSASERAPPWTCTEPPASGQALRQRLSLLTVTTTLVSPAIPLERPLDSMQLSPAEKRRVRSTTRSMGRSRAEVPCSVACQTAFLVLPSAETSEVASMRSVARPTARLSATTCSESPGPSARFV